MINLSTNKSQKLITDYNRPYRAYVDSETIPAGTPVQLVAKVTPRQGRPITITHNITVDDRTPTVILNYQNGNKHQEAFHILSNGRSSISESLKNDTYSFAWPNGVEGTMVLFSSRKEQQNYFDLPLYLDFKKHISPNLKATKSGLQAVLYVDNHHNISKSPLSISHLPQQLPFKPEVKAPFGSEVLYVRGGMNAWQATTPLKYVGNFTYASSTQLSSGVIEYKFADKSWTANANFGSPVSQTGLFISGGSGNLSLSLEEKDQGQYRIELIYIPKEHLRDNSSDLSFFKVSRQ